jgi:hypothetical protein
MFLPSHKVASRKSANREVGKSTGRELSEGFPTQTTLCGLQPVGENFWKGEWRVASGEWQTALTTRNRNGSEWRIVNANGNWQLATGG